MIEKIEKNKITCDCCNRKKEVSLNIINDDYFKKYSNFDVCVHCQPKVIEQIYSLATEEQIIKGVKQAILEIKEIYESTGQR